MRSKNAGRSAGPGDSIARPPRMAASNLQPMGHRGRGRRPAPRGTPSADALPFPGAELKYTAGDSPLGRLLVATTGRGICWIGAGDNEGELTEGLRLKYPRSRLVRTDAAIPFMESVKRWLDGHKAVPPLDIMGTDFQLDVWRAIQRIPLGETRSYSEVARLIGRPSAVRAVANACASNPVPLFIPCHRVIRRNGGLGGYGLGPQRKKWLLEHERRLAMRP